jgi:predicted PurR-regulated permease PerM
MSQILLAVGVVLVLGVLALLIWLVMCMLAAQREMAGQGTGIGLLQQQLEALKAAQDRASQTLQSSLQAGQTSLAQNLQSAPTSSASRISSAAPNSAGRSGSGRWRTCWPRPCPRAATRASTRSRTAAGSMPWCR